MGSDGGKVDIKVLIEGVEVPALGASVMEQLGGVTRANIAFPYLRSIRDLLPRSLVHLFVYDETETVFSKVEIQEGSSETIFPNVSIDVGASYQHYKLFFWGEVGGVGKQDSATSGQAALTCLGFSNYFDTIPQISALRGRGTISDLERRFSGLEDSLNTGSSGRFSTADRITQLITEGGNSFQSGVVELIKEFIETTNDFYRNRKDIIRLSDMIRSLDDDTTGETLMDLREFRRFMRQSVGSRGIFTIRQVLQILGSYLFHDTVEHAAPSYSPVVSQETYRSLNDEVLDEDDQVVIRESQVDKASAILFKPELWWACPPACNVLFPSHYSSIDDSRNMLSEPTRTILKISPGVSGSRRTIVDDYFAPDLETLNELAAGTETSEQEVFQLPHERFQGINSNIAFIGEEVARLTRRDSFQDYMRSYAQFLHWKTVFQNRSVQVNSSRLLPWVMVGYPAVALDRDIVKRAEPTFDPNLEERMLLRRELSALRRCRDRLRARRRRLVAYLESLRNNGDYVDWIASHREAVRFGDVRYDGMSIVESAEAAQQEEEYELFTPHPSFNIANAERRAMKLFTYRGPTRDECPAHEPATLREALGNELAQPIIQVEGSITLDTMNDGAVEYLSTVATRLDEVIASTISSIASVEASMSRVEKAIKQLRDRLLELGWDLGTYSHVLFYVIGKETSITKGQVSTRIHGRYARVHDEDIDLDGTRGDTFENIIKTGPGEFFSDNYATDQIGDRFYLPVYGVKSLVDMAVELHPFETHENDEIDDSLYTDANGEIPFWREVIRDICQEDYEETTASEGVSIEDALESIVEVYRSLGFSVRDVESFISRFVARPIATIVDVLGSDILQSDFLDDADRFGNYRGSQLLSGAGFHQFAFLSEDETFDMSGLEGRESDQRHVATARRSRVLDYVRELASRDFTT